jgi:periplasmic protein TonB
MFDVLMESRAARPRRPRSTLASAVIHGAIIAAAVVLTRPNQVRAVDGPESPTVVYVPTRTERQAEHPLEHRSRGTAANTGGLTVPAPNFNATHLPPVDLVLGVPHPSDLPAPPGDELGTIGSIGGPGLPHRDGVMDEHLVDRAPRVVGRPPEPRYPTALREAGIQGRVVAEFIVDTLGRPELDVLKLDASQVLLAESVRAVLPRYRFTPGEANGHKVRTRVQLPFDFTLTR